METAFVFRTLVVAAALSNACGSVPIGGSGGGAGGGPQQDAGVTPDSGAADSTAPISCGRLEPLPPVVTNVGVPITVQGSNPSRPSKRAHSTNLEPSLRTRKCKNSGEARLC
jgi:hypothetical protein